MKESRSLSALKDSIDYGEKVILHGVGMKIQKPASFGVKSLMLPAGRLFKRTFGVFSSGFFEISETT